MASGMTANFAQDALTTYVTQTTSLAGGAFKVHLVTAAVVPDWDTDTLGDLTEIATGNGYDGSGYDVPASATGFPTIDESAPNDDWRAKIKDTLVQASGGTIPPSGSGFTYAVLTDAHATPASRRVQGFYDLGSEQSVTDGNSLTIAQSSRGQWDVALAKT